MKVKLSQYAKQQGAFTMYTFRRDELMQFEVQGGENPLSTVDLKVEDQSKLENWLNI